MSAARGTETPGVDLGAVEGVLVEHEPVLGWTSGFGPSIVGCSCLSARDYRGAGHRAGQAGWRAHLADVLAHRNGELIPASAVEALLAKSDHAPQCNLRLPIQDVRCTCWQADLRALLPAARGGV